jgi:Zn-dependent peptidase ImmA (M78 family)
MPRINAEILRWARETAGLSLEDAAAKIALGSARGVDGATRLAAMETGETAPTRPLLLKMAKQYRRPLLVFYLAQPPRKGNRGQDFRTLPDGSNVEDEATLDVLLRDFVARQALVRAALEDEEERAPITWIGTASVADSTDSLVARIRGLLRFDLTVFRAASSADDAFKALREQVEESGVYVVLASNLGSHHTTLGTDVFRGLAIADPLAPLVVVNDQDAHTAWSFTLLHEVVHLLLGYTGVSGGTFDRSVERVCNAVASEILLPASELQRWKVPPNQTDDQLQADVSEYANDRKISRTLVAYRLYQSGAITEVHWRSLTQAFRLRWLQLRERQRESGRDTPGGPSYYVVRRHRLGTALIRTTARLLSTGAITTVKASQVLGVKPNNLQTLVAGMSSPLGPVE